MSFLVTRFKKIAFPTQSVKLRENGLSAMIQNVSYIDHFNSQGISYFMSIATTISKILCLEVIHAKIVEVAMKRTKPLELDGGWPPDPSLYH